MEGLGKTVPPNREHVIIYFLQKNIAETHAISFYDHFQKKKWRNQRNRKLSNWKIAAWEWIWSISLMSHEMEVT